MSNTFLFPPTGFDILRNFYVKIKPVWNNSEKPNNYDDDDDDNVTNYYNSKNSLLNKIHIVHIYAIQSQNKKGMKERVERKQSKIFFNVWMSFTMLRNVHSASVVTNKKTSTTNRFSSKNSPEKCIFSPINVWHAVDVVIRFFFISLV